MSSPETVTVEVISCPLDNCAWQHAEPVVDVPANALANIFGSGVMTGVAQVQRAQRVEDALQQHFASHKVEQYLRTITRLRADLKGAIALLDDATVNEPCSLDHHGYCQEHMDFSEAECYQARIKRFVAEHAETESGRG
ncbi:hypothetical protein [Lentzea sp. NPDC092896]|uniref:hypothetical protein n=1 Tax=Lentzea sp. NPDC092896 TaxID=3364127 RepID=UPI0038249AB6